MKKRNIISLISIILGAIVFVQMNYLPNEYGGLAKGMSTVFVAYPLILLGVLIFIIGLIIDKIKSK